LLREATIHDHANLGTRSEAADIFLDLPHQKSAARIKVDAKLTKAADMMHAF
jgi:hypothetical protein